MKIDIVAVLVPLLTGILTSSAFWAIIETKIEKRSAIREALGALLRHEMFGIYEQYKDEEAVPSEILEEMDSLHAAYHALGYNHMGDKIWEDTMKKRAE